MLSELRPAIVVFLALTLVTGVAYPLAVTGIAQSLFPAKSNGSIITHQGKPVGSSLIGQEFTDPKYFWGRLSATSPVPYTAFNGDKSTGSSGSNLSPTNPDLIKNVQSRIDALKAADAAVGCRRASIDRVPVDLVTSSASGLDPHISPAAAGYQLRRVALARGLDESTLQHLIDQHTHSRQWGCLGEPVVNVLDLNLSLDTLER